MSRQIQVMLETAWSSFYAGGEPDTANELRECVESGGRLTTAGTDYEDINAQIHARFPLRSRTGVDGKVTAICVS
ncbi:MAG: hypothetical protein AAFZ01_04065 [Pseudomonadota bacterium]